MANPSVERDALEAAVATRTHIGIGSRVRAVDRDNVGHVHDINDADGNCTIHFESSDGRTAIRTLRWERLVAIDNPDAVSLTQAATHTLDRRGVLVADAERQWTLALAMHGIQTGDADLYRRAVHTAADDAARRLQTEPPEWLTTMLGQRPTTPAAASVWDDATTRVAHHRLLHTVPDIEPGIGPRPTETAAADTWQHLMLRLLEDRIWLTDYPSPTPEPLVCPTPSELRGRQHDLQQLLATAPADQRQFIDRIVNSALDPTQMHDYLTAAMSEQDARRDWIIANWPHIVELEQVTQIISTQEAAPHWPTTQPDSVRTVLDQLRQLAPEVAAREERSLAELTRQEISQDPVRRLEAQQSNLQRLSHRTMAPAEHEALHIELVKIGPELRQARSDRAAEQAFNRYVPNLIDDARSTRIATLAADALTNQPTWVIEHVRYLQDNRQLPTTDNAELATRIIATAAHLDLHGQLPEAWPQLPIGGVEIAPTGIEVG